MRRQVRPAGMVLLALLVSGCVSGPGASGGLHAGFEPPGSPASFEVDVSPAPWSAGDDTVTFSIPLCAVGGARVRVTAVEPTSVTGEGFRVRGTRIVRVPTADGWSRIARGFPPRTTRREFVIPGMADGIVACADGAAQHTELQVGIQATSPDGGGWDGTRVSYRADGRDETLEIAGALHLAGTSTGA